LAQAVATLEHAHGAGDVSHVADHADHPHSSTGLDSRKLLMWFFLASDCMFFGSLIAMYLSFRGSAERMFLSGQGSGPVPHEILDIPYTSISAFVLLMSSLTMVLALASIQRGNQRGLRVWLSATALLGMIFIGGQFYEFTSFKNEGLGLSTNMFGSAFFTLTGFHGAHVTIGVLWLISLVIVSMRGGLRQDQAINVEIAGLYWHFVDIVWIVIFTLVYLIPYDDVSTVTEKAEQGFRLIGLG